MSKNINIFSSACRKKYIMYAGLLTRQDYCINCLKGDILRAI